MAYGHEKVNPPITGVLCPIQPKARHYLAMNFIIVVNVRVCHAPVVYFGDDVKHKCNIYKNI